MAVPRQPVVPPFREDQREPRQRRVEDQAIERLERERQLVLIAQRLPGRLLHGPNQVDHEVKGAKVPEEKAPKARYKYSGRRYVFRQAAYRTRAAAAVASVLPLNRGETPAVARGPANGKSQDRQAPEPEQHDWTRILSRFRPPNRRAVPTLAMDSASAGTANRQGALRSGQ